MTSFHAHSCRKYELSSTIRSKRVFQCYQNTCNNEITAYHLQHIGKRRVATGQLIPKSVHLLTKIVAITRTTHLQANAFLYYDCWIRFYPESINYKFNTLLYSLLNTVHQSSGLVALKNHEVMILYKYLVLCLRLYVCKTIVYLLKNTNDR